MAYIDYSFERTRSSWMCAFAAFVNWLNRLRCSPPASKFCGANHWSYACFTASQSESSIAYIAVSLHKDMQNRCQLYFIDVCMPQYLVCMQCRINRTWSADLVLP